MKYSTHLQSAAVVAAAAGSGIDVACIVYIQANA